MFYLYRYKKKKKKTLNRNQGCPKIYTFLFIPTGIFLLIIQSISR